MPTNGRHLLADYKGCDAATLNDPALLERHLRAAAQAAGATVIGAHFHRFAPKGISGVVLIEESHLSIHTWPEERFASVDFYTCGACDPSLAHETLKEALGAERSELLLVRRGLGGPGPSIELDRGLESPA